jgi:acyl carrier protein
MAHSNSEIRQLLRDYLVHKLIKNPRLKLGDDEPIISGGYIDSFSLVQVGLFIEQQFKFRPDDIDLTVAKMDTLALMAAYVEANQK